MPDVYTELRQRLEDFAIPCVPGKGILDFLRVIFTEQEAEMLSKFPSFNKSVTVKDFARESGYNCDVVQKVFNSLVRRNLIHFEKKAGSKYYRLMPLVVGIYEAFFSTWQEQNPDTLIPAAKAMDEYFKDTFHKAASNSKSPWARIIPSMKAIESAINNYPQSYEAQFEIPLIDQIRRMNELIKYSIRFIIKKLFMGKIGYVINTLKSDGFIVLKRLCTFSNTRKELVKNFKMDINIVRSENQRTIPINTKIPMIMKIYPYEMIRNYIEQATIILSTSCPCRKANRLLDESSDEEKKVRCKFPVEDTCLHLRYGDHETAENNLWGGHIISKETAINIINKCEKLGLVHTSFNSIEKIEFICNCCPCCCGILGTMTKYHQKYRAFVESNFQPIHQESQCMKCNNCLQICPVHAISLDQNEFPIIDLETCIGCGVCVSNCPTNALKLIKIKNLHPSIDTIEALVKFSNQKLNI